MCYQVFMEGAKCPICIEGLGEDPSTEQIYRCSKCTTDFHGTCLLTWTANANTCPACRAVEETDCVFVKIKIVMPHMTITQMADRILNNASMEQILQLYDCTLEKINYVASGGAEGLTYANMERFWSAAYDSDR